jgi:hypothetical protein
LRAEAGFAFLPRAASGSLGFKTTRGIDTEITRDTLIVIGTGIETLGVVFTKQFSAGDGL